MQGLFEWDPHRKTDDILLSHHNRVALRVTDPMSHGVLAHRALSCDRPTSWEVEVLMRTCERRVSGEVGWA